MIRTNMTIKIYRSDVEKMKEKLKSRMDKIWDIYRWHNHIEAHLQSNEYFVEYLPAYDVYVEVNKTDYLTWKANKMLENEDFDFVIVDADEWFEEWHFDERIEDGLIDEYYMFPDSYEVDEIFEKMKSEYKYSMTDLFGFFRFCTVNKDTAIA